MGIPLYVGTFFTCYKCTHIHMGTFLHEILVKATSKYDINIMNSLSHSLLSSSGKSLLTFRAV